MTREIQHVAWSDVIAVAKRDGEKVQAICGARIYPMTEMKDAIPTCTKCHRMILKELAGRRLYTWTTTTNTGTWMAGGAA